MADLIFNLQLFADEEGGNSPLNVSNSENDTLITGTSQDDTIENTGDNVTINAGAGDDLITSSGDSLSIDAGDGNDTINANDADSTISNSKIDLGAGENVFDYEGTLNTVTLKGAGASNDINIAKLATPDDVSNLTGISILEFTRPEENTKPYNYINVSNDAEDKGANVVIGSAIGADLLLYMNGASETDGNTLTIDSLGGSGNVLFASLLSAASNYAVFGDITGSNNFAEIDFGPGNGVPNTSNDTLIVGDISDANAFFVWTDGGNDYITIGNAGKNATLSTSVIESVEAEFGDIDDNSRFFLLGGNGSNNVTVGTVGDNITVYADLQDGNDNLKFGNIGSNANMTINAGGGEDTFEFETLQGNLNINAGTPQRLVRVAGNRNMDVLPQSLESIAETNAINLTISKVEDNSTISITGGADGDVVSIDEVGSNATLSLNLGTGDDSVYIGDADDSAQISINAGDGNDTISGANENTTIQGNFTAATVDGADVVLTTDEGTLTVTDAAGKTLNINGEESVIGGENDTVGAAFAEFMLKRTDAGYPLLAGIAFHPEVADTDPPSNAYSSETWTITSTDDLQLSAAHYSPENPKGQWILMVSGYGHAGASLNNLAIPFLNQGLDVLVIDQRAIGHSEGDWLTMGVAECVDVALWTQKIAETNSNAQITLYGISMGAATVMMAAALSQTANVTSLIEDCGYANIYDVFQIFAGKYSEEFGYTGDIEDLFEEVAAASESLTGYNVADAAPINTIANVTVPALFIHGTADTLIPVSNATDLYNAIGTSDDKKEIYTVEGAEHAGSVEVSLQGYLQKSLALIENSNEEIGASIDSSEDNTLIRGTIYDDSINATGEGVTIDGVAGNDTVNYSESADIQFNYETAEVDGDNVILTNGDNSLTILDAKDKTVIINGTETVISDEVKPLNIDNDTKKTLISGSTLSDTITNSGNKVTIDGCSGDDIITNSGKNVSINGCAGDDTINNSGDKVTVNAGDGDNSVVYAYTSKGSITAGNGNDSITAIEAEGIKINAGEGDNYIFNGYTYFDENNNLVNADGSKSRSTVIAGAGNDTIANQGIYNSSINAGDGDNVVSIYHSYNNTITTGSGADSISVSKGSSLNVSTGEGNDTIIGKLGELEDDDWTFGAYATIDAGAGDDYIAPHYSDNSSIFGGAGNDTIINNGANTTINGGDGNDYIELSNNIREDTGDFEPAVIVASAGNDTIKNYSSVVTLQGEFTESGISGNDVLLKTADGSLTIIDGKDATLNINGVESVIGGDNAKEYVTINDIRYTLNEGAELTYDSEGNVTGIAKGTVTAELANADTSPVITLDGTTAFNFTATAEDGAFKMQFAGNSVSFISGDVTFSSNIISFPEGEVVLKLTNTLYSTIAGNITVNVPAGGVNVPIDSNIISADLADKVTFTFEGGLLTGSAYATGKISYDIGNKVVTLAKDAVFKADNLSIGSAIKTDFEFTALNDSTIAIEGSGLASSVVIKDGSAIHISGTTFGLNGNLALNGGDLSFSLLSLLNPSGVSDLTLTEGANLTFDLENIAPISITAPENSTAKISRADGVLSVTTDDDNGLNISVGGLNALKLNIQGTTQIDTSNKEITFTKDTVAKIELSSGSYIQITANEDAASNIALTENGIALTPNENDGNLNFKFVNSNGNTVLNADLEVKNGTFIYNPNTNHLVLSGGTQLEITLGGYTFNLSNAEDVGGTFSIENGLTFTPDDESGALTLSVANAEGTIYENVSFDIISGSVTLLSNGSISIAKDIEIKLFLWLCLYIAGQKQEFSSFWRTYNCKF